MHRSSFFMVDSFTEGYHQLPRSINASNFNNKYIQVYRFTSYFSQKPTKSAKTLADFTCGKMYKYLHILPNTRTFLPKHLWIFIKMHEFCAICEFCYLSNINLPKTISLPPCIPFNLCKTTYGR